jgi:hypothetical protein
MSFLNQSGDLSPFTEVIPAGARYESPEKASIMTQRRRVRIQPQSGPTAGLVGSGTGAGGAQLQFIIADQGGLLDPRSVVINYTIFTSGTAAPDDGHPFMTFQALLNGQQLENQNGAPKVSNAEMTLAGSQTYYRTAGSFQGFELLSPDLVAPVPTSTYAAATITQWGAVANNWSSVQVRSARASNAVFGNVAGEQRSIPLGLICGLGRMRNYIPLALLGELAIVAICGQPGEVLFNSASTTTGDYSLSQISLEYDVVVPDPRYAAFIQKVASEDPQGLVMPYESTIVAAGGAVAASSTVLSPTSLIVSRATNNLLRAALVQIPQSLVTSVNYPSQSCFSHAGLNQIQFQIGSQFYPQIPALGDAAIFNMSLHAYGAPDLENGTVTNRVLWGNSTNGGNAGTAGVYETAEAATGGTVKFAYGDRCVPCYGFQTIKGAAEPLMVDGVSLAGASGSQLIVNISSAPGVAYAPYVLLTALRFIKVQAGAVAVIGA